MPQTGMTRALGSCYLCSRADEKEKLQGLQVKSGLAEHVASVPSSGPSWKFWP
jgi:hypothetical protein